MSFGLISSLLIKLQAHRGHWVPLATLCAHVQVPSDQVRAQLLLIRDDIQSGRVRDPAGHEHECYGVGVTYLSPILGAAPPPPAPTPSPEQLRRAEDALRLTGEQSLSLPADDAAEQPHQLHAGMDF